MKTASLFKLPAGDKSKYAIQIDKEDGRTKTVKFGQNGAPDFTTHRDRPRRLAYLERHGRLKPSFSKSSWQKWGQDGIFTAGYWSRWLLWEKDTMEKAIKFMRDKKNIGITLVKV